MNKYVSHALAAGIGCLTGIALISSIFGGVFYSLWRMIKLQKDGVRVQATVTRVQAQKVRPIRRRNNATSPGLSRTFYRVTTHWHNPQNGKTYTLKTMINHPEKYPEGSPIPLLVDARHPRLWHRIASLEDM